MTDKRKKAIDHILKHVTLMDPSGTNTKRYKEMFDKMSDPQFDQYMKDLRDKKVKLALYVPNMKIPLKIENILKASDSLGLDFFERLRLKDEITGQTYLTPNKYVLLKLPVRRARQFLLHKLSVPDSDKKIDLFTGQVSKPDKASSISFVESQLLYSRGLHRTLDEFVKVRGGDIHAFSTFKQQLEETGSVRLESLDPTTVPRSAIVMGVVLKCMLLDNNLVENM